MSLLRSAAGVVSGTGSFLYLVLIINPAQVLSAVVYPFSRRLFRSLNRSFAFSIWRTWVWIIEKQNGVSFQFSGDEIPPEENAIIVANHQTMTDILVLLSFSYRCGRLGDLKFFAKDALKYVPGVGWGMLFLDNVFVKRNWERDEAEIERTFSKYKRENIPIFLVSFLEGTRRTEKRRKSAEAYAKANGLHVPRFTLVPRTKGFVASMHGLRDHVDAVYDVTLAYDGPPPSPPKCFARGVKRFPIHVRRYPVDSLPSDAEGLTTWARERFVEKDERLAEFRSSGQLHD